MLNSFVQSAGIVSSKGTPIPIQLGVKAWYDFSDASKFIEGDTDKIGSWLDGSGNNVNISQITAIEQPEWGTRTLNSLTVADFDGGQTLESSLGINFDSHEIIVVTDPDLTSIIDVISTDLLTPGGVILQQNNVNDDTLIKGHFIPVVLENATSSSPRSSSPVIVSQSLGTTNLRVWTNGTQTGLSTISATKPDTPLIISLGGRFAGGVKYNGGIGEVLIFEKELTTGERSNIYTNYLAPKWGL